MIVEIRKSAIKDFKKISKPYKTKIKLAIKNLENFPNLSNIKKLTNHIPAYRLRVGAKMKLDEFEKEILESIENNEWISKGNIDKRKKELKSYIKKKKAISIRVNENDIYEIKKKALENGIPYQNLIQILLHQYAQNRINLSF